MVGSVRYNRALFYKPIYRETVNAELPHHSLKEEGEPSTRTHPPVEELVALGTIVRLIEVLGVGYVR